MQSEEYFGLHNAYDDTYHQPFIEPIMFQVLDYRGSDQFRLLAQVGPITNNEWKEYTIQFSPPKEMDHLMIRAYSDYFTKECVICDGGHILIDAMSHIREVDCEE